MLKILIVVWAGFSVALYLQGQTFIESSDFSYQNESLKVVIPTHLFKTDAGMMEIKIQYKYR